MRRSDPFAAVAALAAVTALFSLSISMVRAQGKPVDKALIVEPGSAGALRPAPVAVMVKTDKKTFSAAEEIPIVITVKNTSKQPVTLHFASGQKYDLELRKGKDAKRPLVWQWSRGRMFTEALSSVLLAQGKTLTFNDSYKPSNKPADNMPRLAPGHYTLTGVVTTMGSTPRPFGTTFLLIK